MWPVSGRGLKVMRSFINMVNGNFFLKYKKAFIERFTSKPDVSVVEGIEKKLETEHRLYDEGMFSDAPGYLLEVSNALQDDEIPTALLNRLSVIFRDVSHVAENEGNEKAGELLIKRFNLGKTGGFELQMEAALIAKEKNIAKRFPVGKNAPGDMKREIRKRSCEFIKLEKTLDGTGKAILRTLKSFSSTENKRKVLDTVIERLTLDYKHGLLKRAEIESHVDLACDKLLKDGLIQTGSRSNVLSLKR